MRYSAGESRGDTGAEVVCPQEAEAGGRVLSTRVWGRCQQAGWIDSRQSVDTFPHTALPSLNTLFQLELPKSHIVHEMMHISHPLALTW